MSLTSILPEWLREIPLIREAEKKAKSSVINQRREFSKRRAALVAELDTTGQVRAAALEKARARRETAFEAYQKAALEEARAQAESIGECSRLQTELARLEAQLRRSADPAIGDAIRALDAFWELVRRNGSPRAPWGHPHSEATSAHMAEIRAAMDACRALELATDGNRGADLDVGAELERITAGVGLPIERTRPVAS